MGMIVYGIRNCDTVKKARAWLDAAGHDHAFHDYKVAGNDTAKLGQWVAASGWETILNRSGTTFRKLPDGAKAGLDADKAIALMLAQPSMIKRPIVERDGVICVGFGPDAYAATWGAVRNS